MRNPFSRPASNPRAKDAAREEEAALETPEGADAELGQQAEPAVMEAVMPEPEEDYRLKRLQADFDNYRRRVTTQQAEQRERMQTEFLEKLFPVYLNFGRARQQGPVIAERLDATAEDGVANAVRGYLSGIEGIAYQLDDLLKSYGIELLTPEPGTAFDAQQHDAIGRMSLPETRNGGELPNADSDAAAEDDGAPVLVSQLIQPGFRLSSSGRVLQPAQVLTT